jgi:hypothetical protein
MSLKIIRLFFVSSHFICGVLSREVKCKTVITLEADLIPIGQSHAFISLHASPRREDLFSVEPETAIVGTEQVGIAVTR